MHWVTVELGSCRTVGLVQIFVFSQILRFSEQFTDFMFQI